MAIIQTMVFFVIIVSQTYNNLTVDIGRHPSLSITLKFHFPASFFTLMACIIIVIHPICLFQKAVTAILLHMIESVTGTDLRIFLISRSAFDSTITCASRAAYHASREYYVQYYY